ncbi:hypothetical protein MZK49_15900 [Ensifer sesbaniae]|nr:hypothetical protein [Ensifer sesbaniae]MCK3778185.1 hypothetical protein [Ensifer sesbaniae]
MLRIQSHGKAAGVLTSDQALASDVSLLVGATARLPAAFKGARDETDTTAGETY